MSMKLYFFSKHFRQDTKAKNKAGHMLILTHAQITITPITC